jgi:hypothetical protein
VTLERLASLVGFAAAVLLIVVVIRRGSIS